MIRYMYVSCKNVQLRERISGETWNHQGSWREAIYHATQTRRSLFINLETVKQTYFEAHS